MARLVADGTYTLKYLDVELYPTHVSKRIVCSVARSATRVGACCCGAGSLCCTSMHWSCQQRDVVQVNTAGVAATGGRAGFGGPLTDADAAGAPADGIAELTGVARTTGHTWTRADRSAGTPKKNAIVPGWSLIYAAHKQARKRRGGEGREP